MRDKRMGIQRLASGAGGMHVPRRQLTQSRFGVRRVDGVGGIPGGRTVHRGRLHASGWLRPDAVVSI